LNHAIVAGGHQFGRDFGGEDVLENARGFGIDVAAMRDKADQMLDQRLRHRGVGL